MKNKSIYIVIAITVSASFFASCNLFKSGDSDTRSSVIIDKSREVILDGNSGKLFDILTGKSTGITLLMIWKRIIRSIGGDTLTFIMAVGFALVMLITTTSPTSFSPGISLLINYLSIKAISNLKTLQKKQALSTMPTNGHMARR